MSTEGVKGKHEGKGAGEGWGAVSCAKNCGGSQGAGGLGLKASNLLPARQVKPRQSSVLNLQLVAWQVVDRKGGDTERGKDTSEDREC